MNKYGLNSVSPTTNIVLNGFFALFALACLMPFLLVISVSLTGDRELIEYGYRFWPKSFSLSGYQFLLGNPEVVMRAYGVTIFVSVVGTFVNMLSVALFAYPLSRNDFPFKKFFTLFVFVTMLFNGGLVPTYLVNVNILHLRNSIWALILPMLGGGFNIFMMRTYFKQNIPYGLVEAAKIDGAGETRIFFTLILPLAVPIIAAMSLFSLFTFWNNWTNSLYYITNPKLFSLQFVMQRALQNFQFMQSAMSRGFAAEELANIKIPEESVRMAMVLVGIGPIILAYPFFQKHFIKGLTVGAIKG